LTALFAFCDLDPDLSLATIWLRRAGYLRGLMKTRVAICATLAGLVLSFAVITAVWWWLATPATLAHAAIGPAAKLDCVSYAPFRNHQTPWNIRAAELATRETNAGYLNVMLEGKYTDAYLASAGNDAPKYTAEDLRIISAPVDFVGLNVYMPDSYVVAAENRRGYELIPLPASFPHMDAPWHDQLFRSSHRGMCHADPSPLPRARIDSRIARPSISPPNIEGSSC
jgi:hypothetical protein